MAEHLTVEKQPHHGDEVWTNVPMDALRRSQCLCLNCADMGACNRASRLYDLCRRTGLALAVTRCPVFARKERPDGEA